MHKIANTSSYVFLKARPFSSIQLGELFVKEQTIDFQFGDVLSLPFEIWVKISEQEGTPLGTWRKEKISEDVLLVQVKSTVIIKETK